jgi:hypothetical protein
MREVEEWRPVVGWEEAYEVSSLGSRTEHNAPEPGVSRSSIEATAEQKVFPLVVRRRPAKGLLGLRGRRRDLIGKLREDGPRREAASGEEVVIAREAFIHALPFSWLFRQRNKTTRSSSDVGDVKAPNLSAALVAIAGLHADAAARQDVQAMRAYEQAVRCLLLPTRKFLSDSEDLAPQPEWPLP